MRRSWLFFFCLGFFAETFAARAQFTLTTNNSTITVSAYSGRSATVVIPGTTNGLPVVNVGNYTFQENNAINSVIIPVNVTNLGTEAFYYCTNLTNVSMPSTLTTIGVDEFAYCYQLTTAPIPASATNIGSGAFTGCSNLTTVTLPNGLTNLADNLFYQSGITNLTIPGSVTTIGNYVFNYCFRLTNIVIPAGVTNIGLYSFNASSLTNITVAASNPDYSSLNGVLFNKNQTLMVEYPGGLAGSYVIPNTVTNLAGAVFNYSYNPASITIPTTISSIPAGAFAYCYGLSNIVIPNTVTNIGQEAFQLTALTNLTIPNSVTTIGQQAFSSCTNLTSVTIPASVTNLGGFVFYASTAITQFNVDPANPAYRSIGGVLFDKAAATLIAYPPASTNANYTVPVTVNTIANNAFSFANNLTNVLIPANVTNVGAGAFYSCASLKSAYFEGSAPVAPANAFQSSTGTVYYLPGTAGWTSSFGGLPTAPWYLPYPLILGPAISGDGFGIQSNKFGFSVSWATNLSVIVEAATNVGNPVWVPLQTNSLTNGTFNFSDAQWTNYSQRYYRLSAP